MTKRDEYDAIERLNWTKLKAMGRSPAHYRYALTHPRADTPALRRGRAVHAAVFEPMQFARKYVAWDGGRRAGKTWDAFCEEHAGIDILTADEWEVCEAIQTAVREDPVAAPYVSGGKGEHTVLWEFDFPAISDFPAQHFECKGRLDFVTGAAVVDLKTTRSADLEGFGRECFRYNYHTAAAWYRDGYEAATGKDLPFVIVAVEAEPPHVVSVYRVPDIYLELGRKNYRGLLNRLDWCRREDSWPGYADCEQDLQLPRYALPYDEEDVSGLDLEIGEANGSDA